MKDKNYYKEMFKDYPDVVDLVQFREMLGGIADSTARKLMRGGIVKHFYIRNTVKDNDKIQIKGNQKVQSS
ncbi:hypothetical protein [Tissierella pigra]|uniref:Uncharacterized protein n=1 Tax=Tissierella pigra TaxID=2607614 RepID=A0A6N7XP03_9FIRM|nr:hypothetical protein [Tissierella pigra]MSU02552.1 hypothetical protein [Tissierella pigra]